MTELAAGPISLTDTLAGLRFMPDRTPTTPDEAFADVFATMSGYRDGGIYVGEYAGNSEWERHRYGDELVLALDGSTKLIMLIDGVEQANELCALELVVVPQGVWHRFETPAGGVKILTVTPQPTDHQLDRQED